MEKFQPTQAHLAARRRKRRVLLQLDALGEAEMRGMEPAAYREYLFGYADTGHTQIDGIYWDCMFSGDFYAMYESRLLPRREMKIFAPWLSRGFDLFGEVTRGGRERGLENILVHRISEVDLGFDELGYAEKRAHPEWLIPAEWYTKWLYRQEERGIGLLNLANPEVRARKLAILEELLRKYEWDGLEIDLCRHTPFLPAGREWENRAAVTEFMSDLRHMLDRLERENGHPYLLSVRTGESEEICRADGVDLETWLALGLLDSITAGGRSFSPDIEGLKALIDRFGGDVQLYATIDYHHATDGYALPPIEVWRGVVSALLARGADGIKLFNWSTATDGQRGRIAAEYGIPSLLDRAPSDADTAMRELGDRAAVDTLDRTFVAERRGGYPWSNGNSNTNRHAPLPTDIDGAAEVRIYVSGETEGRDVTLTVLVSEAEGAHIAAELNGHALPRTREENGVRDNTLPPRGQDWASGYRPDRMKSPVPCRRLTCEVPPTALRGGWNTVRVTADRPARLEKAEIHIQFVQ